MENKMTNKNVKKTATKLVASLMLSTALLGIGGAGASTVLAESNTDSASVEKLIDNVRSDISDNTYRTTTGEGIQGSSIYNKKGEVTQEFDKLTNGEKTKVMRDIKDSADRAQARDTEKIRNGEDVKTAVTKGTVSEFWKQLRENNNTVAASMITAVTKGLTPDFNSAYDFLSPFIPFFNTATGVFLILASISLFLFIAIDVFYFMNSSFQYFVGTDTSAGGDMKGIKNIAGSMVSPYAKKAMESAISEGKNPLWKYFASTWFLMLGYAVVLLFFATNSMLVLVGPFANLLGGLLGF